LYIRFVAGCPKKRELQRLVADAGGAEPLLERVANGETVKAIAESLGVSRGMLSASRSDDEQAAALLEARRKAASVLVEQALVIADHARPATSQVAKLQIDTRLWIARAWDRAQFAEKQQAPVTLNLAQIHAQVVRERCKQRDAERRRELDAVAVIEAPGATDEDAGSREEE